MNDASEESRRAALARNLCARLVGASVEMLLTVDELLTRFEREDFTETEAAIRECMYDLAEHPDSEHARGHNAGITQALRVIAARRSLRIVVEATADNAAAAGPPAFTGTVDQLEAFLAEPVPDPMLAQLESRARRIDEDRARVDQLRSEVMRRRFDVSDQEPER